MPGAKKGFADFFDTALQYVFVDALRQLLGIVLVRVKDGRNLLRDTFRQFFRQLEQRSGLCFPVFFQEGPQFPQVPDLLQIGVERFP